MLKETHFNTIVIGLKPQKWIKIIKLKKVKLKMRIEPYNINYQAKRKIFFALHGNISFIFVQGNAKFLCFDGYRMTVIAKQLSYQSAYHLSLFLLYLLIYQFIHTLFFQIKMSLLNYPGLSLP
jgi:hypothetical protein